MSSFRSTLSAALVGGALASSSPARAQTAPVTPPTTPPTTAPATPNAETPPGGIARGVVPPPRNVDPGMVTPPPADKPTMPVIKPPAAAR